MLKTFATAAFSLAVFATSANAQQVLLHDTFDTENGGGGATQTNYASFANWNVTGNVDLVKSGTFGITCSGSCVDLDGFTGPGELTSKLTFAFNAGDVMRFSARIGGAQRGQTAADPWTMRLAFDAPTQLDFVRQDVGSGYQPGFGAITVSNIFFNRSSAGGDPFSTYGIEVSAAQAGSVRLSFSTTSADNFGPILDEAKLERMSTTVPEPSTYALMGVGLLSLGVLARRRRA